MYRRSLLKSIAAAGVTAAILGIGGAASAENDTLKVGFVGVTAARLPPGARRTYARWRRSLPG